MNSTNHNRRLAPLRHTSPDDFGLGFAAFVLAHSGCDEESSELRLDERTLLGWCWRCNELRIFVMDEGCRRKGTCPNPFCETGPES